MENRKRSPQEFDDLLERVDEVCREAERVGTYVREGLRRQPFYPDRRRADRSIPSGPSQSDTKDAP